MDHLFKTLEVFKLGTPIGFGIFVELSMYSGAAIILAPLGEAVVSGHAVALNIASIVFYVTAGNWSCCIN